MSVTAQNLAFQYNQSNAFKFPSMELKDAEHQLILGNSGKGKTTLLHLLGGLLSPTGGSIIIDNTDITQLGKKALDRFRGKNIGLIFQRSYFVKSLSVKDNLLLAQKLAGKKEDLHHIETVLSQMDIHIKLHAFPSHLSVGEQQRVSIARAVLNEPALILADEPTSSLDNDNAGKVADLLEKTASSCRANLLIVTHDQRLKNRFKNVMYL